MKKETKLISSNDKLTLNLLERGGFALRIRPE